ncbi:MAG: HAD hydrolase-like protein, partial [Oscillospiraceae bacterium]|nr:HAD hydrolase-like protein [Oscillospiraceae bacterium]
LEDGVDCLLAGFDTELTFRKLEDACILLNRGVDFIATNPDWVCPTWYGSVPDCGSVCEMLRRATGRSPRVIGKPQPAMARLALERTGFAPDAALMVGDRLYTDIASGVNAGIDTAFVLSGEGTREDLADSEVRPTWVFDDISALHRAWTGGENKGAHAPEKGVE